MTSKNRFWICHVNMIWIFFLYALRARRYWWDWFDVEWQVTVIDQAQRNSRSASSNLSAPFTPHITLEIPNINYGNFLSPIHEVPTPLPSPSHTPNPSLRRQSNLCTDSPTHRRCKDDTSSDDSRQSSSSMLSTGWESDRTVHQMPISIVVTPSAEARSPSRSSNRPPPLQIINSNFARFEVTGRSVETEPSMPVVCVSEPSPEQDGEALHDTAVDQTSSSSQCKESVLKWKHISIGSPPIRKATDAGATDVNSATSVATVGVFVAASSNQGFRRGLKDSFQDKSCSLDLPVAPPMITITANFSEVESDTDAGLLGKCLFVVLPLSSICTLKFTIVVYLLFNITIFSFRLSTSPICYHVWYYPLLIINKFKYWHLLS